jgi:hypothetical protein
MASTNEDAMVLATSRLDDGRLLVVRHLPDRATVEIGFWRRDESGVSAEPAVLELAAEAVEVSAFAQLCERVLQAPEDTVGEAQEIAAVGPFGDGARIVAFRAGDKVALVRSPERDNLIHLARPALRALVVDVLPDAMQNLERFGFGLIQQGDQ